jgi:hypothetical protein
MDVVRYDGATYLKTVTVIIEMNDGTMHRIPGRMDLVQGQLRLVGGPAAAAPPQRSVQVEVTRLMVHTAPMAGGVIMG